MIHWVYANLPFPSQNAISIISAWLTAVTNIENRQTHRQTSAMHAMWTNNMKSVTWLTANWWVDRRDVEVGRQYGRILSRSSHSAASNVHSSRTKHHTVLDNACCGPHTNLIFGPRSFHAAAPTIWNSLPSVHLTRSTLAGVTLKHSFSKQHSAANSSDSDSPTWLMALYICLLTYLHIAFSALTLLVRKSIRPGKLSDEVLVWLSVQIVWIWSSWCHCISKLHCLLPRLNPDWFNLSGTGLPRLYWKGGR